MTNESNSAGENSSSESNEAEVVTISSMDSQIQENFTGIELRTSNWSLKVKLPETEVIKHSESYEVAPEMLDLKKRLFDKDGVPSCIKQAKSVITAARKYWVESTRPTISRGVRMIRMDEIDGFRDELNRLRDELDSHIMEINDSRIEWIQMAAAATKNLFNPEEYPHDVRSKFRLGFTIRQLEPDQRLKQMDPTLYKRLASQFRREMRASVRLAEQELARSLSDAVKIMVRNLQGEPNGQLRKFGDRNIERLDQFFDRFNRIKGAELGTISSIVNQAKQAVSGVDASLIKDSPTIREQITESFSGIDQQLDSLMEDAPRREIRLRGGDDDS